MKHFYIIRENEHRTWIDEWNGIENTYQSIKNNPAKYIIEGNSLTPEDIETAVVKSITNTLQKAIDEGRTTIEKITKSLALKE